MYYTRHTPAPPLRESVDYNWCLVDGPAHSRERILPAGTTELVINLRDDEIRIHDTDQSDTVRCFSGAVVCGPYSRPFDIDARWHGAMLGVHFKPGGAQSFLSAPLSELRDAHVDLENLWGPTAHTLRSRVCEAQSPTARFAILESALTRRCHTDYPRLPVIAGSVDALTPGTSHSRISDLAENAGLSHRRFVEVFTANVGLTPKLYSRLRRFRRALAHIGHSRPPGWSQLALTCGYSDQAHMIREFQAFSRLTPVDHLRRRELATKDDHVALDG